jgi:predicted DNA-binding transcriptional regulator YafY
MAVDQLERQWSIINTLCRRRKTSAEELAEEYHVSQRTIRRDLDKLSRAFPVVDHMEGRRKYWSLVDGFKNVPPIIFFPTELYALQEGTRFLKTLGDPFLRPTLESISHKIRSTFDREKLETFENLKRVFTVSLSGTKDYSKKKGFLSQLFEAAAEQRQVEIGYQGLKDKRPRLRKVDPYKLWYRDGTVYLIGLCHMRKEIRVFAADRVSVVNFTDHYFLTPKEFDFEEYVEGAFSVMIEDPVHVKVRFAPEISRYIEERDWHPSQKIKKQRDGSIVLNLTVGGTLEIKRWILSFGPQATVLEPEELVHEIQADLDEMGKKYGLIRSSHVSRSNA